MKQRNCLAEGKSGIMRVNNPCNQTSANPAVRRITEPFTKLPSQWLLTGSMIDHLNFSLSEAAHDFLSETGYQLP